MISNKIDIFLSHDWPTGIWEYGNKELLLRIKPYFREEMSNNLMGSPPLMSLLQTLKPNFWFSAHLHVKFPAIYPHENSTIKSIDQNHSEDMNNPITSIPTSTRFLALDKVLPGR